MGEVTVVAVSFSRPLLVGTIFAVILVVVILMILVVVPSSERNLPTQRQSATGGSHTEGFICIFRELRLGILQDGDVGCRSFLTILPEPLRQDTNQV